MKRNGEDVPRELLQELGTQVAVGQLARDVQFGNDINNLLPPRKRVFVSGVGLSHTHVHACTHTRTD